MQGLSASIGQGGLLARLWLAALLGCACLLAMAPAPARADSADINAAARGVVRVVIIGREGGEVYPVSHGTGFAVTPEIIATNAHVVMEARADRRLEIALVPSDGGSTVIGKILSYSPRNDLALIRTTQPMNLPPLTIAGNADTDSGEVTSVGYPMNVDRAQGLAEGDIFRAQPPVKSKGFLSGLRPSRDFDTLLHTAPIARGNSGGPLLDNCGRVVGVNSFGADSDGADAEFYFAVSTRELLPYLRQNDITPQVNGLPCRSLAELEEEERARSEREMLAARQREQVEIDRRQEQQAVARRDAELAIIAERENGMMLAFLLLLVVAGAGQFAWQARQTGDPRALRIATTVGVLALLGALVTWVLRPGFAEVEERKDNILLAQEKSGKDNGGDEKALAGNLLCVVQVDRSRVTTGKTDDIPFSWESSGCVNERTQYGLADDVWKRVFVPQTEAVVSVNSFEPAKGEYIVERYLLGRETMDLARAARAEYTAPTCNTGEFAARQLGQNQATILNLLPARPNERLVYKCSASTAAK